MQLVPFCGQICNFWKRGHHLVKNAATANEVFFVQTSFLICRQSYFWCWLGLQWFSVYINSNKKSGWAKIMQMGKIFIHGLWRRSNNCQQNQNALKSILLVWRGIPPDLNSYIKCQNVSKIKYQWFSSNKSFHFPTSTDFNKKSP